jgi:hypothetical protein
MQVPVSVNDTVEPETVQIEGLPDEKVTTRPELAVASTVEAGPPTYAPVGGDDVKLIVWEPRATAKDCWT